MIHKNRIFQIVEEVTDIAYLSETLIEHSWTLCTAFKLVPAPDGLIPTTLSPAAK